MVTQRKKNVRNDSLPPNRRMAPKGKKSINCIELKLSLRSLDCRLCQKRRIICDRSVPQCQKCNIRGLPCPGFPSVYLRWDQGVASRGKFTGRKLPLLKQEEKSLLKKPEEEQLPFIRPHDFLHADGGIGMSDYQPLMIMNDCSPTSDSELSHSHLSNSICQKLLNHFFLNVASRLTWFDSPGNPWRSLILPLTKQSACLRLSILCLSSAHISAVFSRVDQTSMVSQVNHRIREGTLQILSQKMHLETCKSSNSYAINSSGFSTVEMLASMLVLCYSEILTPNSKEWKLHLRACRAIIERHRLQSDPEKHHNTLEKFLVKEVFDLLVCGNFSIFSRYAESITTPYQSAIPDNQAWMFLSLIDEITLTERLRFDYSLRNQCPPVVDMSDWHSKLDKAHSKAISMFTSLPTYEISQQKYSCAIIKAHYYAVLTYCYQALANYENSDTESRKPSIELLLETIQCATLEPCSAFAHDLFFPLFIAGTECQKDKQRQGQIEGFFRQSILATGFWCNETALSFLRELWANASDDQVVNWIEYARDNEHEIGSFFVF